MIRRIQTVATLFLTTGILLAGISACAPRGEVTTVGEPASIEVEGEAMIEESLEEPMEDMAGEAEMPAPQATMVPSLSSGVTLPGMDNGLGVAGKTSARMIIKNAEISLRVAETDVAIDRVTQIVADSGGYIVSSRIWYQDWGLESYKYATISIGVPVDQFEITLRRLRDTAVKVLDEHAGGEDVTDQFIDLESRLRNLESTRDRILDFLEAAQTVEEALKVNQQLSEIEGQIEAIQGQMNYLEDRAAFSTIFISLEPELPELVPTPTPTPTITPTPTATPTRVPYNASQTVNRASHVLGGTYRVLLDIAIWLGVFVLPILAPVILVIGGIGWFFNWRRMKKSTDQTD